MLDNSTDSMAEDIESDEQQGDNYSTTGKSGKSLIPTSSKPHLKTRTRTTFDANQLRELERTFLAIRTPDQVTRNALAARLGLKEQSVTHWFQVC